ncbi:hypothetical protein [Snodgrassella communis]|uniref:hypothetical protein n=1 Tax=Snodgrassella communis TaxID=2946699 RepID=UPI001EF5CBE0|nr:hypothetical protein [Snodgrassella communis]
MKKIKLRAFEITNIDINNAYSDLSNKLSEKLISSGSVEHRRMRLSLEDPKNEEDLISNFQQNSDSIFCTMLRIELGNNVQHIASELFKKKSFTINDLNQSTVGGEAIFKHSYYFLISDDFLITNLAGNITIKRLETYLNWFLGKFYQLTPLLDKAQITELSEIKSITVGDNHLPDTKKRTDIRSQNFFSMLKLKAESYPVIKNIFNDAKSITEAQLEQIISVKLLIEFRKSKKSDPTELQKLYGALLKPVSDLENYTFHTKSGKKIKSGKDVVRTKSVNIETTDSGFLDENQLLQEMAMFIRDLKNGR